MTNPSMLPVLDKTGKEIVDSGKSVLITSVGGALSNIGGTVIAGPYRFRQIWEKVVRPNGKTEWLFNPKGEERKNSKVILTCPYWQVHVHDLNLKIHFCESELKFL